MDQHEIEQYIVGISPDVQTSEAYGYRFFFFGDDHRLPFATIASSDNAYDSVSSLDRPGVFRLNIGVSKQTFQSMFDETDTSAAAFDFTALDQFMPHPDYAKQFFICILSPSDSTLAAVKALLNEAHGIAERRHKRAAVR